MDTVTLAQSALLGGPLKAPAFWAELDAAIQSLPVHVVIYSAGSRDYRLSKLQLRLGLPQNGVIATWTAESAVLEARARLELAQLAQAWLRCLEALRLPAPPVAARVQAASSLLSAGFSSVSVKSTGQLVNTPQGLKAAGQPLALAA